MATARKTPKKSKAKTPATRMASYRARMKARGLKPVVLWLPDSKSPERRAEIERQCRELAEHYRMTGDPDQAFIDAVFEWPDD